MKAKPAVFVLLFTLVVVTVVAGLRLIKVQPASTRANSTENPSTTSPAVAPRPLVREPTAVPVEPPAGPKIAELLQQLERAREDISRLRVENESLTTQVAEIDALRAHVTSSDGRVKELEAAERAADAGKASLEQELAALRDSKATAEEKLAGVRKRTFTLRP